MTRNLPLRVIKSMICIYQMEICKKSRTTDIYRSKSDEEKKEKSSSFYIYFFSLYHPFFFIRSSMIFHVVFQSSRLVTILSPDGHCVLRCEQSSNMSVCLSFQDFSIREKRFSYKRIIYEDFSTIEILIKCLIISFYAYRISSHDKKNKLLEKGMFRMKKFDSGSLSIVKCEE